MGWREAFFAQARGDNEIRRLLNRSAAPYAHQLHHLQMLTEKLAKAYATQPHGLAPPEFTHSGLVKLLRSIQSIPSIKQQLGYTHTAAFRAFIASLIPLADRIEKLAPSMAGVSRPNPEYPWQDLSTGEILTPHDFPFAEFNAYSPQMAKLEVLLDALFRMGI